MKKEDAAWLAGYIDGDGCICLEKTSGGNRRVRVVIDSADGELLDHVMELVGEGSLVEKKRYSKKHRRCWSYRLFGVERVDRLLRAVLPYLRCEFKKKRAEMVVNEWAECTAKRGEAYTPELAAKKADFERRFLAIGAGRGSRA